MTERPERIGLISDIHANLVALEAVLDDMPDVDGIVCAGDLVGYGPSPKACIDIIRERDIPTVVGNHDRAVFENDPYESGDQYAIDVLSEADRQWLSELPRERLLFDGRLKVVHDHPEFQDKYTFPSMFKERLLKDESVLVLGHTHVQAAETFDAGIIVNPGSVGQPRDDNPAAAYAVVDLQDCSVSLERVSYDIATVQDRIDDTSIYPRNGKRLEFGK